MKNSLHNKENFAEILHRIDLLKENSTAKWGRMNASQMLLHCAKILDIVSGKIILPKPNFFLKKIREFTKIEMRIFNNGIPRNMPTFEVVKVDGSVDFHFAKSELLRSLDDFKLISGQKKLPESHELFGKMTYEDWGFLEYKHLQHHLKQFGI